MKKMIPQNPGRFRVQTAMAGNFIVINDKTGKNQVIIPCRNQSHAKELCEKLNSGDHNGQIWV
jgi:hypothetical protein